MGLREMAVSAGQKGLGGRPPLTDNPEFLPRLYGILPALAAGDITVAEAANEVGCSRRSLRRYLVKLKELPQIESTECRLHVTSVEKDLAGFSPQSLRY